MAVRTHKGNNSTLLSVDVDDFQQMRDAMWNALCFINDRKGDEISELIFAELKQAFANFSGEDFRTKDGM